jgi:RNA methyltransferase, TrmH family
LLKTKELTICGLAAVKARFQSDPASILRLFFDLATGRKVGPMCKALAVARKVYRSVEPAELVKISGSIHHGGIVAVVSAPSLLTPKPSDLKHWAEKKMPVLVLDRVGNAHNLGALIRTAAYLGVNQIVIADAPESARPNDAAYRVAEGGMEQVTVWLARDLARLIGDLRAAGYMVMAAATRGGRLQSAKSANQPMALVMGNEEHGIAPMVAAACTRQVTIPGTGAVESLNVSVAGAILMWELFGRTND